MSMGYKQGRREVGNCTLYGKEVFGDEIKESEM